MGDGSGECNRGLRSSPSSLERTVINCYVDR